jgi:hypothetical protein
MSDRTTETARSRVRELLAAGVACALFTALGLASTTTAHPVGDTGDRDEARGLHSALAQMTELAQRRLRPPALRLARDLPVGASRLNGLREPASTVEGQLSAALDELGQMNALTYDPHYLPALLAVGRAFAAASGKDPLTKTTINPDYLGLQSELAGSATRLDVAAGDAGTLSRGVKRLTRALIRSQRSARLLERRIERIETGLGRR